MLWAAATPITRVQACQETAGGPGCSLAHGLPWYFTATLVAVWVLVVVAVFAILRFRLRGWLARRGDRRAKRPALPPAHGSDVELY
jgi:hypothetical protein